MPPKDHHMAAPMARTSPNSKVNRVDVKSVGTASRDSKPDFASLKRKRPGDDTDDKSLQVKARRDSSSSSFDCVFQEKIRAVQVDFQKRMIEHGKTLQAHKDRLEKQSGNNCKLNALLHECRETIEGLEKAIKELEKHFHRQEEPNRTVTKITKVERCLDKHDARLREFEKEQKGYSSRLDTLQTKIDAHDNDVSGIKENLEANRMGLEMRKGDMSELKKDVEANTKSIKLQNETADALEARLLSYEGLFAGIEKKFDSLRREQDEKMEQLASKNKRQDEKMEQLVRENKQQQERIEQLVKENTRQDEKMKSHERTIAQQGGMIKKQEERISGQDNRVTGQSECLIEQNSRAKTHDEKMTQQAKKMETLAKQIEEHNSTMEEQTKRLQQLECTNRQSFLELQAGLEERTKAAVSKAGIKLEADLESVKQPVTVSENAPSTPRTGASELKNLEFQIELIKARLDRHEIVNRNLISKEKTQEQSLTTVNERLKTMREQVSSIQTAQSEFTAQLNNHVTSERLKGEIEHLQNHIRECWDRLKESIELQRQGLVSGVNQRVATIHEHIAVLTSGLNAISGEHERVVGHLANIAAPFRPAPYAQYTQHHLVDQNSISPQPISKDNGGTSVPVSHTAVVTPPAPSHASGPQPTRRSSTEHSVVQTQGTASSPHVME